MVIGAFTILLFSTVAAVPAGLVQVAYAHAGDTFSAFTSSPPVIDGAISPGEWSDADSVDISLNLPEGGTTPGTIFVMNDGTNLYMAVRFERSAADDVSVVAARFDNDHDGTRETGDDFLIVNNFAEVDFHLNSDPAELRDTDAGGTNDLSGSFGNDGTFSVLELSHPLDSADDTHDFSLAPGDTVGFLLNINIAVIPDPPGQTFYPSVTFDPNGWADIVIAAPEQTPVGGEILPTSLVTMFVAGAAANALWIIPVVGGAAAAAWIGIVRARKHLVA